MSWSRLFSRCGLPTAPRKYFVVTMLVALMLHSAGNSTPRCSKLIDPSRQLVMTTSRRSHVTSSYGCTPGVVKTRLTFRPFPRAGALPPRRARLEDRRSSVSVMVYELSLVWGCGGGSAAIDRALTGVAVGTDSSGGSPSGGRAGGGRTASSSAAPGRRHIRLHAGQQRGSGGDVPLPQLGDLLLEVLERGEGAVDAGEAEVGHLVELPQRAQDCQPHLVAGHLRAPRGADGVLHLLGEQLQLVLVDRPALTRPSDTGDDLGPVERLAHPAALDDGEHRLLDGGEPAPALGARPTAARRRPLIGLPRVDDSAVGVVTERTAHFRSPPPPGFDRALCGPSWGHPVDVPGRT